MRPQCLLHLVVIHLREKKPYLLEADRRNLRCVWNLGGEELYVFITQATHWGHRTRKDCPTREEPPCIISRVCWWSCSLGWIVQAQGFFSQVCTLWLESITYLAKYLVFHETSRWQVTVSFFPHQQQKAEPFGVSFLHFGQFMAISLLICYIRIRVKNPHSP